MDPVYKYANNLMFMKEITQTFSSQQSTHVLCSNENVNLLTVINIYKNQKDHLILVVPNLFNTQKIYDILVNQLGEQNVIFFPQDELLTTEMLAVSDELKFERIHAIEALLNKKHLLVITNTTGYIRRLMPLNRWKKAIINAKQNDEITISDFLTKLITLGYKKTDFVENKGEFRIKGGILDIYPINRQYPIRIEWFDDFIESIREFYLATQRSIRKIKSVKILPMHDFFYSEKEYSIIKEFVENEISQGNFDEKTINRISTELDSLQNYNDVDKLTRYQTFLPYDTVSLADYCGNKGVVFWDYDRILDQYHEIITDLGDWHESIGKYASLKFELVFDLEKIYNKKSLYIEFLKEPNKINKIFRIRAKEALDYNNNIHMLFSDLKKYNNYITTIITFESKKRLNSFVNLIDDKVTYHILGKNDEVIHKKLNLLVTENKISFELLDSNLIVLTEDNLFKQVKHKHVKYQAAIKDTKKLTSLSDLRKGDYVVHYEHGIGRYLGIKQMTVGEYTNDYIHIAYKGDDTLYIPVENIHMIWKYVGTEGTKPKIHKLGSSEWAKTKIRVRKKVKDIADNLIKLYALREQTKGYAFSKNTDLHEQFASDFPYILTDDQEKAIDDINKDMENDKPMDRLLCGDVGYGKTEVAMRAAFKAVYDQKQVVYLAPTTVLSRQHFYTFKKRFDKFGIKVALLNRFVTRGVQNDIINKLAVGEIDIVIGTHRLLSKDIVFADLGLLIIDEEQRFGVEHKERIKEIKVNIDVLSLSATPIPRTLQMAIMGVKSMSLLETPPMNRFPVQTYVLERKDTIIRDAIEREIARKGQVFYLYNRVDDIGVVAAHIKRIVPTARVAFANGKMSRLAMEEVIQAFIDGEYDVLVSTTIIETGIDIPNANTLLIHDSDRLGLAQLYQIRGRVGRSDRIAYAYLMFAPNKKLNDEAIKRLKTIKEFTELGSGFKIAMRDLSIRGAGDVLGTEQSGFIDSVGLDLYLEMLKEEVQHKQTGKTPELDIKQESHLKLKVNRYIDSSYIGNEDIKVEMHRKIAKIKTKHDLNELALEFKDRFGKIPKELDLYMHEKLFEYLAKEKKIVKVRELKNNITLRMSKEKSSQINGEYLFTKANEISRFIRFQYKNEQLDIIIDTIKLSKHHLYVLCDLLEIL